MAMVCLTYAAFRMFSRDGGKCGGYRGSGCGLCFPVVDPGSQLKPGISLLAFDAQLLNIPRGRSSLTSPRICPREHLTLHNRRFMLRSLHKCQNSLSLAGMVQSPEHGIRGDC